MTSFFSKIFSDPNEKFLRGLQTTVDQINKLEKKFESFSDVKLREKMQELKRIVGATLVVARGQAQGLPLQESLDQILPEVFAVVREAAKRTIGQRHFDEQVMAGIVLHQGKIAEQKTGEGKTLSATLAVALNALTGRGVHIVTVNDYLARRDTNWMGPIYHLLGLSVACLNHEKSYLFNPETAPDKDEVSVEMENLQEVSRREAYRADITYGTNNEFGFDYLRDNLAQDLSQKVQRSFAYAIVDEVDSILIDEARTPLIISAPDQESTKLYQTFSRIVPCLKQDQDYEVNEKERAVSIQDSGIDKVEKALGMKNIYSEGGIKYVHQLEQALRAHALFKRDRDYLVKDNQVIIIDEFTGRLMPGRRFSEGLHQALEAKEGVRVQEESRTLASITFQNYFRMYQKLAGMTGTALSSAEEFDKVYHLGVAAIPTHKALIRRDLPDRIYRTEKAKFQAIIKQVKKCQDKGQPVLIGTRSVERNEYLSALLRRAGIAHEVLNAKNHEREAQIIAQAGRPDAVTVATNMAGRGVDIVLGGKQDGETQQYSVSTVGTGRCPVPTKNDWQKLHKQVIQSGGLCVIGTERHEARRIDDQLRGRSGRQGDPGQSQFFVSLEDELMRVFGGDRLKSLMTILKVPEDLPIENKLISRTIEKAQARVEGYHFDGRKHTLEYDDVLNQQRQYIYQKRDEILQAVPGRDEAARNGQLAVNLPRSCDVKDQILTMMKIEIGHLIEAYTAEGIDIDGLIEAVNNFLPIAPRHPEAGQRPTKGSQDSSPLDKLGAQNDVEMQLKQISQASGSQQDKIKKINQYFYNLAQQIYDLREKQIGQDKMQTIAKFILLRTYDIFWMEHLDNMEHLRQSVSLRAYGHLDPLVEYKNEASRLFRRLLASIQSEVVNLIFKIEVQPSSPSVILNGAQRSEESRGSQSGDGAHRDVEPRVSVGPKKPGRNDPCPCGSGKKYKKCCGR